MRLGMIGLGRMGGNMPRRMRFASQGQQDYESKFLAILRKGFGGHALKQTDQ
ncbi:MAG: hypothetical protein ACE5KS_00445 [Woeseiaceae bacterium]